MISPGDLTSPHKKYEGITSCTKCHALGGGIPDTKCLDCHDKLAERIRKKAGVHAKYTDACIKCHTDHKGGSFKIVSLEKDKFNHKDTDYPLLDKHSTAKCEKCHKKGGNYTGLSQECISCHKDKHKGELDRDCERCHNIKGWKEIEKFNHDRDSKYALTGKHIETQCDKCHVKNRYRVDKFEECRTCHKDPHKDKPACKECHTTESWKKVPTDHAKTKYPLIDKHLQVKCDKCHKSNQLTGIPFKTCNNSACHNDPHKRQFTDQVCEACHNIKGWKPSLFNHAAPEYTGYKLEGKHIKTACEKCHVKGRYKPLNTKSCDNSDCHKDTHRGQFKDKKCEACHTLKGWKPSLFEHNEPKYMGYKLEGKHVETVCEKCHVQGRYKPLNYKSCDNSDCHKDTHKGQFKDKKCEACHTMKGWKPSLFEHNAREYEGYRLDGKHLKTSCEKCHADGKYKPLPDRCYDCHEKDDTHKKELGNNCAKCHSTADWKKSTLDHNRQTNFPLIGQHKSTECEKCHENKRYKTKAEKCIDCHKDIHKGEFKEECGSCHTQNDWFPRKFNHKKEGGIELRGVHNDIVCTSCHKTKGEYKGASRYCSQCHADPHFNQFGSQNCAQCHSEKTWNPTQFDHSKTGYPLIGGHRTAECQDCHRNRVYRNTTSACFSCHLSQYNSASDHLSKGYSKNCTECHSPNFTSWSFKHVQLSKGCSRCHINGRPASHTTSTAKNTTTCEVCHTSITAWTSHTHPSVSSNCSSCHLSDRPASHSSNPTTYSSTCESCHISTTAWSSRKHTTATTGCSSCHQSYSTPAKPASHTTNNWTTCETCHKSTTAWTFIHTTATTGCSSCHLSDRPASHSSNPTTYSSTCENCHISTALWASRKHTTATTGCSSCHQSYSTPAKPASHTTNNWTTCETCHKSTTAWTFIHTTATTGCSSCHLSTRPATHINNTTRYSTTCENCHKSITTWTSHIHPSVTTNCSGCHLTNSNPAKPASHTTNNWTTCETCHKSTTAWAFTHSTATSGCSSCHLSYSTPAKPASHTTYNWTTCETCHKSTSSWTFTHPTTTFPLNHAGTNPTNCTACHPGGAFTNKGGCIECHTARGKKVHKTTLNSECLRCHPYGTH
ncbi:MAG: hypothetical protein HZA18_06785 [Nitrospirae bacterium]|nr:hypothetical protein [Nitrospirota bacterium]